MRVSSKAGRRRVLARTLGVFAVTAVTAACGFRPVSAASDDGLPVTGYVEGGTARSLVTASAPALTTLGVDGINISADGARIPFPGADDLVLLRQARREGLRADLLIGNFSARLADFDPRAARKLLGSPSNIHGVASALVKAVKTQGWNGITVDFEELNSGDRAGLAAFITELKRLLPAGRTVSVDVTAFTSRKQYAANGYDLRLLGKRADRIVLMAYDEHGPTWNGTGPIGGLPWQRAALRPVLALAPSNRIDLGVAGYGYTWPKRGTGVQLSDRQARQMVRADGSSAIWDRRQGEWTATLRNGTVLWWSDARSWRLRVALAKSLGLHGLALWSLGLSDPLPAQ